MVFALCAAIALTWRVAYFEAHREERLQRDVDWLRLRFDPDPEDRVIAEAIWQIERDLYGVAACFFWVAVVDCLYWPRP
jgi:hypothetical protein